METIQPESREITPDVPDAIDLTLPLDAAAYRPTDEELAGIVEKIKRLIGSPPEDRDGDRIFYSDGIGWHDGWIPMSPSLRDKPPDINHVLTWRYRHGRVVSVTVSEPGKRPWVEQRVWHNSQGAPVLSFRYYPADQPYYFQWGDYDRDGLLRRVIQLKADDFSLMSVQVHDNGPKYCRTVIRDFDAQGRLRGITRYADNKLTHTDVAHDEPPRFCGTTHRTTGLCLPEDWGLAPFYPIPPGPMQAAPGDPPGSMLRIASIRVHPAAVEEQCRAEVVIDNGGVGYQTPPGVVCDDIVIRIYDARGELIFRAGHGWMGMQAGQLTLNTDTHSNTLRAAGGWVFLFPKPGRYTLSITARRNDRGTWTDSRSVTFHVGMDRSEFRVLD